MSDPASFFQIDNAEGGGDAVIVCEHASNDLTAAANALGLGADQRQAHIAWDPGALGVAKGLSSALDAPLIHATASRLIYDLNRPPDSPGAMPARSEAYDIPGNRDLTPRQRLERTRAHYIPFHAALFSLLARRLASGRPTALITVHSFTPVYFGTRREVEFGIIHEADDRLARAILARDVGLLTRLNDPYSAADGVTHTLALHATPLGLGHAMLEIRNDLIATPMAQQAMADRLAPAIREAVKECL
ncbi:N-formylglutamate amidohydrolase [Paracoccus denitrificans]|jgi:predicted N-formylglutamate amidohydrolase|uniref:N-formylglutamate amidohydrolase n=1 Tax=Paracoccus denitrificans (strain Pd 1222) TaxID=318586 RepID=A1BAR2_PARDP|nr:N-formylglutamate amidohydrolase [Paracoccus denitrificans]ABL72606.1 N-formylglutamate amidohydrolase [Paracoccus denitrificans PD1222]MBB4630256.1 putative N-formylglutamate amidohydrolase [Paracoccus denitrificans]MCU7431618.1 N-formylglutamate amidohydrolase [Paracoccus denitrificans]QAR29589.1 N-formylglutamate amidohydrolase [Paracoccus denitrificans]UFS67901.1 N-formylglutamate amidohydrolase [Paracoccus denitrificans]